MQGLWSTHRRAKVNLNSTSTPISGSTTPNAPPPSEEPTTDTTPAETPLDTPTAEVEPAATSTDSKPVSAKRKLRSTREDGSKRAKLSGGSVSKDHTPPTTRLSDLGGIDACIEKMLELVAMPLCHPEIYLHTGVQPPRGVLLHGPPGCGKTMLAHAIAGVSILRTSYIFPFRLRCIPTSRNPLGPLLLHDHVSYWVCVGILQELGVPFINISAPSVVSGMSGESEKTLRDTFDEAKRVAPCLLFIDEIDAITPKRESAQREMERRIVAQFLTCMDGETLFSDFEIGVPKFMRDQTCRGRRTTTNPSS